MRPACPKILVVLQTPPPVHGSTVVGSWIVASDVLRESFECRHVNTTTSRAMDEIGKGGLAKAWRYGCVVAETVRLLAGTRFDLCYFALTAKGVAFYKDAVLVALVSLFRLPVVFHLHSKGIATRGNRALDRMLYRMVFGKASAILLSPLLYPDLGDYLPPSRVFYCPNGIPWSERKVRVARAGRPPEILFLSNMMEEKGVFVLLEACRLLAEEGVDFRCRFVGAWTDVREAAFAQRVCDYGLSGHIRQQGSAFGDDKESCFEEADVFAFPTYYHNEAFPLVLIEAMKHSLPVVSTSEGGIPDLVVDGSTGLVCPTRDSGALARALKTLLLDDELCRRMGAAGRERFEERFTLRHFENRLGGILRGLTTGPGNAEAVVASGLRGSRTVDRPA